MAILTGVKSDEVENIWPLIEEDLSKAMDEKYTTKELLAGVKSKEMQLWIVYEDDIFLGSLITQIINYPKEKSLFIIALGGRQSDKWFVLIRELSLWAKGIGCISVECLVKRPGMQKIIKRIGFKEASKLMRINLWAD